LLIDLLLVIACGTVVGKELYVSPHGAPENDGTRSQPLDFRTALSDAERVRPGDTVWLLGGTYHGPFEIGKTPAGTPDRPIVYRAAPGERVTLTTEPTSGYVLHLAGTQHVWFWGLEVTVGGPPSEHRGGGVSLSGGREIKLINLVIHDNPHRTGIGGSNLGSEFYGCIIYRNGKASGALAHGTYTQNRPEDVGDDPAKLPWKVHRDCIVFQNYGWGVHSYATGPKLANLLFEGVVAYGNGDLKPMEKPTVNFLAGGCKFDDHIVVRDCFTYYPDQGNFKRGADLGYTNENGRVTVERCHFAGGVDALWIRKFREVRMSRCVLLTANGRALNVIAPEDHDARRYDFHENTYHKFAAPPLQWNDQVFSDLPSWQQATRLDATSRLVEGRPDKPWVVLRPNQYEPEKAFLIVYNWPRTPRVSVELKKLWRQARGTHYRIVSVENIWGQPAAEGRIEDKPVDVPLAGVYAPEFACYLVSSTEIPP
jgi:hypothetical protein